MTATGVVTTEERTLSEAESDLRATSEDIAADAVRLKELEDEKARLDPTDPRVQELSREAERLARGLGPKAIAEREIADIAREER